MIHPLALENLLRGKFLDAALVHSQEDAPISIVSFQTLLKICCLKYDRETSLHLRFIVSNLINRIEDYERNDSNFQSDANDRNEMKVSGLEKVVTTNNIELIKHCFSGEEHSKLLKVYYVRFLNRAMRCGAGEAIAHLSNLPFTISKSKFKISLASYFWNISQWSPVNLFSLETHKTVIDQLLLRGVVLNHKKYPAMEYLFKSTLPELDKTQLSDFLLSRGATLNHCNPQKSQHSLLTIAISKREVHSAKYLVTKAEVQQGYEISFMSNAGYRKAWCSLVREWKSRKRKRELETELLFFLLQHAMALERDMIEIIVRSPKMIGETNILNSLLQHHRKAMITYDEWEWMDGSGHETREILNKYFRDEFATTIMLGTKPRLNQQSVLRHLNEDHFVMIFDALFNFE